MCIWVKTEAVASLPIADAGDRINCNHSQRIKRLSATTATSVAELGVLGNDGHVDVL